MFVRRYVIPLATALMIAGCASPAATDLETEETGSVIVVDDDTGTTITVTVNETTGAIVGHVLTDAGFGLPGAMVVVIGAESSASTNETGWFEVPRVPPGKRIVRAEHESYRPAESEVDVTPGKATRLTITLVPPVEGEAGYRPHIHDYWAGRTEVPVIDQDFEFHRAQYTGRTSMTTPLANKIKQAAQGTCIGATNPQSRSGYTSSFFFDDPNQLVWPGTGLIKLSINWGATDYIGGENVAIVWKAPNMTGYAWTQPIKKNEPFALTLEPPMWDNAHQAFTLWEFYLCAYGRGEANVGGIMPGRMFVGKYHVSMSLQRGELLLADPPHPRFWANGSTARVLEIQRTISCSATNREACTGPPEFGRDGYTNLFQFKPSSLVPPGTAHVQIWFNWSYGGPIENRPLGFSYSPANEPPTRKENVEFYRTLTATSKSTGARVYEIPLQPGEADSFYQQRTNWAFYWGVEGEEKSHDYFHTCACELRLNVAIDVSRSPPTT